MIDTDKYEGHTLEYGMHNARLLEHLNTEPNRRLIIDAPLLLEEVKRLRGLLREVADDYTDADGITYEIYCEFGGEEE
tara:strand:- start:1282 stop:1515 length:234 start_codon:yes stop_codon:yes gene_type:complete